MMSKILRLAAMIPLLALLGACANQQQSDVVLQLLSDIHASCQIKGSFGGAPMPLVGSFDCEPPPATAQK
jgi:hypothetical protein